MTIAHVVWGPNLIGLHFSAVFHIGKNKVSLWWGLQRTIVLLSLIKPGNHDCIYINPRLADFTVKITVSIRICSSGMLSHLLLFFFFLVTVSNTSYMLITYHFKPRYKEIVLCQNVLYIFRIYSELFKES